MFRDRVDQASAHVAVDRRIPAPQQQPCAPVGGERLPERRDRSHWIGALESAPVVEAGTEQELIVWQADVRPPRRVDSPRLRRIAYGVDRDGGHRLEQPCHVRARRPQLVYQP